MRERLDPWFIFSLGYVFAMREVLDKENGEKGVGN